MKAQTLRETLGFLGVAGSLVFVGFEIRQNTIASQAAAYQAIGIATAELHAAMAADPDLIRLATHDPDELAGLSEMEWRRVQRLEIAWHRLAETVHLQVLSGLLPPDAMSRLGYASGFRELLSACLWPGVREFVGESYREYLEREVDFSRHDCSSINPLMN